MTETTFAPSKFHAEHVKRLAANILGAHINNALHIEHGADGGRGDAVLARAGLGDDAMGAHALREQNLSHHIIDFMRSGMVQILPLQIDLGPAELLAQMLRIRQRTLPSDIFAQIRFEFIDEFRIVLIAFEGFRQPIQYFLKLWRNVAAAEFAEHAWL